MDKKDQGGTTSRKRIDISHTVMETSGQRLDVYISERFSVTRTKVKSAIEEGHILVDNKTPRPSQKVKKGMVLQGFIPEEEPLNLEPQDIPLQILYEDEYILAINKPAGMVVHPSFGHPEGTLVNAVLGYLKDPSFKHGVYLSGSENPFNEAACQISLRPGIVHRLDKGTTGVILVAKDSRTQEMLSAMFKQRGLIKVYRAIVEGNIIDNSLIIEGNIGRHPVERKKMAVTRQGGRDALTTVKILDRLKGYTYVEAYPKTGRTHQIRVHLAHIGNPIVGDEIYGKRTRHLTERPMLHAFRIELSHPIKGIPVFIEAPIPEDMASFLEAYKG
ncbi:MAG TPA: RluA family pseudouridine synthase [Syntrophorhabdaceae bacterium]|nr:RluA family pseudouridine synthase [Syntrophorhabdaceae bacterium]HOL04854.1 RluA family pseudouridine synthase [Syntrophorhabdaceae bacterium]HPP41688.1 RluA family pseudouridine synthase [Syntrophorhabdaceae bacterium]